MNNENINLNNQNELTHYGILGMKWGVRRSQKQLARISNKAKKKGWSEDAETAAKLKTKSLNQMSNAELKKFNERKRLENEYKQLTKKQKNAGQKFAADVGRELAKDYTKQGIKKGVSWVGETMKYMNE